MVVPKRAPVRPRVLSPVSGEALLLEDEVRHLLTKRWGGLLWIAGPAGAGKSTALEHLAHVLAGAPNVCFLDYPAPEPHGPLPPAQSAWVIYAAPEVAELKAAVKYRLAPWRQDEWIEYLLAVHPERCASVMARLCSHRGGDPLEGNPELWRIALDRMATDEAIPSARAALELSLREVPTSPEVEALVRQAALELLVAESPGLGILAELVQQMAELKQDGQPWLRVLRHRPVQRLLAAERIVSDVEAARPCEYFRYRFPRDLVREVATAARPQTLDALRGWFGKRRWFRKRKVGHAMAASILHAAGAGWTNAPGCMPSLAGAYLDGVAWPEARLTGVDLSGADLSRANLQQAKLDKARLAEADLREASLRGASLAEVVATKANFTNADLRRSKADGARFDGSNLEGANFRNAELCQATFNGATLTRTCFIEADLAKASFALATDLAVADFSGAELANANLAGLVLRDACFTGASFRGACLTECDLEDMDLPAADFQGANLEDALLTGSRMPGARFDQAKLVGAGLADIDWEGASLRNADLSGASFHLGSSRSGLVGSPIASEGSRTGFYTDDFTEQDFKAPEEIRKANLCHADLRGAILDDVDFYLVDLRHALFDPEHEAHLRHCGAILESRR